MPESIKKYGSLSKPFQDVGLAANGSGPGVFSTWFVRNGGDRLNGKLIDEGEVFDVVERLLAPDALDSFLFLPPPVAELRAAYEAVREEREAYLRYVLSVQRGKILHALERFRDRKIEKRIGSINRGIRKRVDMCAQLERKIADKRADMLDRAVQGGITRMTRGVSPEMAAVAEAAGFSDAIEKETADPRRRADAIIGEISKLIGERLILRIELTTQEETRDLLRRTEKRLAGLGGPLDIAPASEATNSMSVSAINTPPLGVCRTREKVKTRGTTTGPTNTGAEAGAEVKVKIQEDDIDKSLRLIRELIEVANAGGFTCIRILIGDTKNVSRRTRQKKWEELIKAMDFSGKIEFVNYERLMATQDVESPVIVPDGLYTHIGSWNPQKFSALRVLRTGSPGSLIGRLASSRLSDTGDT